MLFLIATFELWSTFSSRSEEEGVWKYLSPAKYENGDFEIAMDLSHQYRSVPTSKYAVGTIQYNTVTQDGQPKRLRSKAGQKVVYICGGRATRLIDRCRTI